MQQIFPFKLHQNGVLLFIKLNCNSKKNEVSQSLVSFRGIFYLKVFTTALPVENRANKALISLVARFFAYPKSNISILHGEKNSYKHLLFTFADINIFQEKLSEVLYG